LNFRSWSSRKIFSELPDFVHDIAEFNLTETQNKVAKNRDKLLHLEDLNHGKLQECTLDYKKTAEVPLWTANFT
jgi:hypothetical protein